MMETLGRTKVVIRDGVVVEVGEPMIRSCPLAKKFDEPVHAFTKESIRKNVESRIKNVGMFTKNRVVISDIDFVPFGASEMISFGIRQNIIEGAVIVCDGAGTVITKNPFLVQGIGGRMSGLVRTSPIPEVIESIENNQGIVLDRKRAAIDQVGGVELAHSLGMSKVAVTITSPQEGEWIRSKFPDALIFAIHLTGISKEDAERLVGVCDLLTGCASRWIREVAGKKAKLQAGTSIPVFAMTERGKELVLNKVRGLSMQVFVKLQNLPYLGDVHPEPLI
ncbi:MAG: methanogenesis marker 8 protein [Candidatus Methanomethylicaceae archaeon]